MGASYSKAVFGPGADFFCAAFFEEAHFDGARFSGDVSFERAAFCGGTASFDYVTFSGNVGFYRAVFLVKSSFYRAKFFNYSYFASASFSEGVSFASSEFSGDVNFNRTVFSGDAVFYGAIFNFGVEFSGAFNSKGDFRNAVFEGPVRFQATISDPERYFSGAFYAARFAAIADFSGAVGPDEGGRLAAAFGEAQFEKTLILTDGSDRQARSYFHRIVLPAVLGVKDDGRDARLRQLEAGCRTLKIAMGKAKDELREQRYYRFQLQARLGRSDIDGWEKAFGLVYRLLSDFGSSLWRPLLALVLFTALCGQGYAIWGASLAGGRFAVIPSRDFAFEGQGAALAALKPFATIEAPKPRDEPVKNPAVKSSAPPRSAPPTLVGVLTHNAAVSLGLRVATALQVVVSTLLVFLFALAVKRRFQIS